MSELLIEKLPFDSKRDRASTVANHLHWKWILNLEEVLQRIYAWVRVQRKMQDGKYKTKEGKYLSVGVDLNCEGNVVCALTCCLESFRAEAEASIEWKDIFYVSKNKNIFVMDEDHNVITTIPIIEKDQDIRYIMVNPNGREVYVTKSCMPSLSVIDTSNHKVITSISNSKNSCFLQMAVTPNGKEIYVSSKNLVTTDKCYILRRGDVLSISTADHTVKEIRGEWEHPGAFAITPDSEKVYVIDHRRHEFISRDREIIGYVFVIATANHTVIKEITVGDFPVEIAITPDGKKVYVANWNSSTISVIRTFDDTVITTIHFTGELYGVVSASDDTKVYAFGHAKVFVIATSIDTVVATIALEGFIDKGITVDSTKIYVPHKVYNDESVSNNVISIVMNDAVIDTIPVKDLPVTVPMKNVQVPIGRQLICTLCRSVECVYKKAKFDKNDL
jgi:YVTN family beta-propeller protein